MPEFIDPVFAKTSPKRSFSVIENEPFGLVFAKTGFINSVTGQYWCFFSFFEIVDASKSYSAEFGEIGSWQMVKYLS